MNHYGETAQAHDRKHHPDRYSTISDPEIHYRKVGERTQTAVTELRDRILGSRRDREPLDEFQTRSHQALHQAEELILDELLAPAMAEKDQPANDPTSLHTLNDQLSRLAGSWSDPPEHHP